MSYLFDFEEGDNTSLFQSAQTNTTLFHSGSSRTKLFFTPPGVGLVLDGTWAINGMSVSPTDLIGTYSETSTTNIPGDATLYFSIGTFSSPLELISTNKTTGTDTVPFTNPDPTPNPDEDAGTAVPHPELNNITFSACYANATTYSQIFTASASSFDVASTYLDATIGNVTRLDDNLNTFKVELRVDTTYLDSWLTIASGIFEFDYNSADPVTYNTGDNTYYGSQTTTNNNVGGQTAPFDRRYRATITDTSPYYYGNFVIVVIRVEIDQEQNLTDLIGNATLSLSTSTPFNFFNSSVSVPSTPLVWNGISSIALFDDRIEITRVGDWTITWAYNINGGTFQNVSGDVEYVALTNGDVVRVLQPDTGNDIVQTFTKFISGSYVSNPPTSYNLNVEIQGVNLPATVTITQGATTLHTYTQTTQVQDIGDLRALGIYGVGVVTLSVSTINSTFDASYYSDGVTVYSGSEIIGYNSTVAESPLGTLTWSFNGTYQYKTAGEQLYYGDYATLFDLINNATPDATSFTSTFTDSDFVSPAIYTVWTEIPVLHKTLKGVLFDTSQSIQSPVYTDSEYATVGERYFKSDIVNASFNDATNELTFRVNIQTASVRFWRLLGSAEIYFDYDANILDPYAPTQLEYQPQVIVPGTTGQYNYGIVPIISAKAGTFDMIEILVKVLGDGNISTDLSNVRLDNIKDDNVVTILSTLNITVPSFSYTWVGISDFTFTASSITIIKNSNGSYTGNYSYIIERGGSVVDSGTVPWSQTTISGLTIFNNDIVTILQPISGTDVVKTISGITFSFTFANPTFTSGDVLALSGTYDNPQGLCIHPNGSAIGIFDDDGGTHAITIYDMLPAFDIQSASQTPSNILSPNRTNGRGLFIDETNGQTYYIRAVSGADQLAQEIPTSSTSQWNTISFSGVNNGVSIPQGATNIATSSGLTFYGGNRCVISSSTGVVNIYDFTASPLGLTLINQYVTAFNIRGLDAKPDGSKLYALLDNGDILEFDITQPGDILNTTPVNTKSLSTILGGSYPGTINWAGISIDRTGGNSVFVVNEVAGANNSQVFKINL